MNNSIIGNQCHISLLLYCIWCLSWFWFIGALNHSMNHFSINQDRSGYLFNVTMSQWRDPTNTHIVSCPCLCPHNTVEKCLLFLWWMTLWRTLLIWLTRDMNGKGRNGQVKSPNYEVDVYKTWHLINLLNFKLCNYLFP